MSVFFGVYMCRAKWSLQTALGDAQRPPKLASDAQMAAKKALETPSLAHLACFLRHVGVLAQGTMALQFQGHPQSSNES